MSEYYSHPESSPIIPEAVLTDMLEIDGPFCSLGADYDERRAISDDAATLFVDLKQSMHEAAQAAGIELDEKEMNEWQPDTTQLRYLHSAAETIRKRLRMVEGVLLYEEDQVMESERRGVPLRPHQRASVRAFQDFILHADRTTPYGGKSGLIEMPTGTGKTGIFANIASLLKHGEHEAEPVKVLVLVPTQTILNQTMGREGERGFGKFAPHLDIGAYYQHEKELDSEVVVMTTSSFNQLQASGALPHFDAVIVDEAHTVIGEVTAHNIETYCQDKIAIGLTATPEYDEERSAYSLFKHTIDEMSFRHAVTSGKLAPVRGHLLEAEADYDHYDLPLDEAQRKHTKRNVELEARIREATKIIENALERGLGVIVRCPAGNDIDIAVEYANFLGNKYVSTPDNLGHRPVVAEHVGGSHKRQGVYTKYETFEDFDNGNVDVLTYVKAIGMGWDSPHAKVLINLAPTTSAVEMRQAIGRVMRLIKDSDGKAVIAEVYDFKDKTLGDKQYTCLDALETKSGQLLAHDPEVEAADEIIPKPRKYRTKETPIITETSVTILGEIAINHLEEAVLPDDAEIAATIDALHGDTVSLPDACRILGVNLATLKNILFNVGSSPHNDIKKEELNTILELFPDLYAMNLPDTGFTLARNVAQMTQRHVRILAVIPFARRHDITPFRFRGPDGKIAFYFADEDLPRLLELLNDPAHRHGIATYKHLPNVEKN